MKKFLKHSIKVTRKFVIIMTVSYVSYQVGFVVGVSKGEKS